MNLQQENEVLKKKLEVAESWMKREIQNQIMAVSKKHILEKSGSKTTELIATEMDEVIVEKILSFFSDIPLSNIPEDMIEHLSKSEIQYYLLQKGNPVDTLPITIGYQKILESLIEDFIITLFRQFSKRKDITTVKDPDALEASLEMVISKGYSLSIGRLHHILSQVQSGVPLSGYKHVFSEFLESYSFLKNTLLEKEFLIQLQAVVESEVFSSKRHSGTISSEEVSEIRTLCTGNLSDKNCLIYKFFQTQTTL